MGGAVFGFSIGDFISGINLAIEVYKACKEQGGAASKSETTIRELETYCKIFQKLRQDSTYWKSTELVEEASDLLSTCQNPLEEFQENFVKRWKTEAGVGKRIDFLQHGRRRLKSFHRKAKWALSDVKEVEKLRAQITPSVAALGVLLDMEIRSSFDSTLDRQSIVSQAIVKSNEERFRSSESQIQSVQELLARLIPQQGPFSAAGDSQASPNTQHGIMSGESNSLAQTCHVDSAQDLVLVGKDTNIDTCITRKRTKNGPLVWLLCYCCIVSREFFVKMIIPYLMVLKMLVTKIYTAPTMLLSDNIIFTDALGRQASLTFNDFSHWQTFMARIRVTFADLPIPESLLRGKSEFYELSKGKKPKFIEPIEWTNSVHPQSQILMVHRICVLTPGTKASGLQQCYQGTSVQSWAKNVTSTNYCPSRSTIPASAAKMQGIVLKDLTRPIDIRGLSSVQRNPVLDGKMTAAVTSNEERREAELSRCLYIRFHRWPAVSFNIPGFQQIVPGSQRQIAHNILATMDQIYVESDDGGFVILCGRDEIPGLITLSNCSSPIGEHLHELQDRCKWTPSAVDDPKQRRISHPARVSYLLGVELNRYRLVEEKCAGCGSQHWFWFNAPNANALASLERWRLWIERRPFTWDGRLKKHWHEKVNKERQRLISGDQKADFSLTHWLDEFVDG